MVRGTAFPRTLRSVTKRFQGDLIPREIFLDPLSTQYRYKLDNVNSIASYSSGPVRDEAFPPHSGRNETTFPQVSAVPQMPERRHVNCTIWL